MKLDLTSSLLHDKRMNTWPGSVVLIRTQNGSSALLGQYYRHPALIRWFHTTQHMLTHMA